MAVVSYSLNGEELTSKPKHVGHSGERELLLALFETTGGKASKDSNWASELKKLGKAPKSDWRNTRGWDPAIEPSWHHEYVCAFYGITLADNGYVEAIKLGANGLGDNLPGRMLRGLPKLKHLDLSDNDLRGGLPNEVTFQSWPGLTHLALSDNPHLGGSIPESLPQLCPKLVILQLHNSALTGHIPAMLISKLPWLHKLLLHDNQFTGASPLTLVEGEILESSLKPSFQSFEASSNSKGSSVGASKAVRNDVRGSVVEESDKDKDKDSKVMAASIVHRPLSRISLHGNNFNGPLGILSACIKLKLHDLSLGRNQFTGNVDSLLERWSESTDQRVNIASLSLDRNLLTGKFPVHLNCIRFSLKTLNLSHNKLTGPLDGRVIGNLMVLERLVLSHNEFSGTLPESLSSLSTSLQQLVFGHNQLSGALPCGALSHLHKLQLLDLQHNHLSGPCTDFFMHMTDLRELNLGFNELSGPMPLMALGKFQQAKPPSRRLKVCVMQPNPRMLQPTEDDVAELRKKLPHTNVAISWKSYTY